VPQRRHIYFTHDIYRGNALVNKITTLRVSRQTRDQLAEIGSKDESFDQIIRRLVDFYKKNSRRK